MKMQKVNEHFCNETLSRLEAKEEDLKKIRGKFKGSRLAQKSNWNLMKGRRQPKEISSLGVVENDIAGCNRG